MRTAKRGPKQVLVLNPLRETWCLSPRTQACMFTCICMLCKRTHTGAFENQNSMLSAFLSHSPPYILRRSLSLSLEFTIGLDWLTSESQEFAYLWLCSMGFTSTHHPNKPFIWVLRCQTLTLPCEQQEIYQLSRCPSPCLSIFSFFSLKCNSFLFYFIAF